MLNLGLIESFCQGSVFTIACQKNEVVDENKCLTCALITACTIINEKEFMVQVCDANNRLSSYSRHAKLDLITTM